MKQLPIVAMAVCSVLLWTASVPARAAADSPVRHQVPDLQARWDGLSATTSVGGLDVTRAQGRVERHGQRVVIVLFGDSGQPVQTIRGRLSGQQLAASRTVENSDVVDEPLKGTWTVQRVGRYRSESIVLSNIWTVVILTRSADTLSR